MELPEDRQQLGVGEATRRRERGRNIFEREPPFVLAFERPMQGRYVARRPGPARHNLPIECALRASGCALDDQRLRGKSNAKDAPLAHPTERLDRE